MTNSSPSQDRHDRIMSHLFDHLNYYREHYKNEWIGIFLVGSQNYKLDHENSDVDSRLLVLPTFEEIVLNKPPFSKDITLPNGEHCVIRDVRLIFREFVRQSPNSLEILFTDFAIFNPIYHKIFEPCIESADKIAHYNPTALVYAVRGIGRSFYHDVMNEAKLASVDTVFLGKKLAGMYRALTFLKSYIDGKSLAAALIPERREELVEMKRSGVAPEEALRRAYLCKADMETLLTSIEHWRNIPPNEDVLTMLNSVLTSLMIQNLYRDPLFTGATFPEGDAFNVD